MEQRVHFQEMRIIKQAFFAALLLYGLAPLLYAQGQGEALTVCVVIEKRISLEGLRLLVEGIDGGNGALRGKCQEPISINGFSYPRAVWVVDASPAESSEALRSCPTCVSLGDYINLTSEFRRHKGFRASVRVVGYIRTMERRSASEVGMPTRLAGFGKLGLFPVELVVLGVQKWERLSKEN